MAPVRCDERAHQLRRRQAGDDRPAAVEGVEDGVQEVRLADARRPMEEERGTERRVPECTRRFVGARIALAHHEAVEGLLGIRRFCRNGKDGRRCGDAELDEAGAAERGSERLLDGREEVASHPVTRGAIGCDERHGIARPRAGERRDPGRIVAVTNADPHALARRGPHGLEVPPFEGALALTHRPTVTSTAVERKLCSLYEHAVPPPRPARSPPCAS